MAYKENAIVFKYPLHKTEICTKELSQHLH